MSVTPFPINPHLTGIAMAYRNSKYIADLVMPRVPPFSKPLFTYLVWDLAEGFTVQNTFVGRRSVPNEVDHSAKEETGRTEDYALDEVLPNDDVRDADNSGIALRDQTTESLSDLIALDREKRVAGIVFDPDNYTHKDSLTGAEKWTDPSSDPIATLADAISAPLMRPNTMVVGRKAFSILSRHPKVVGALSASGTQSGIARREAIADMLELDEIIVGEAYGNATKKGQAPNLLQLWGNSAALLHLDPLATNSNGRITWGFTAQYGERVSTDIDEPKIGLRGAVRVRVGESVGEVVAAPDAGFLIQNVA